MSSSPTSSDRVRPVWAVVVLCVGASATANGGCRRGRTGRAAPVVDDAEAAAHARGELAIAAARVTPFASSEDALRAVLAERPRVLAVGEAHAQQGTVVSSAAARFTRDLLPLLAGRASDLLLELMMPPQGCADASEAVRTTEQAVVTRQAPTNQREYVAMGERARALGIVPDALRPSCEDLDAMRGGSDADWLGATLETIARLTTAQATRLVRRDARSDADHDKIVVVYGGLLHNDLTPAPEAAPWSYAPALDAETDGGVVSLDLIVPELVGDDATWRNQRWWSAWAAYEDASAPTGTVLLRTGPRSFVLVFARSVRDGG